VSRTDFEENGVAADVLQLLEKVSHLEMNVVSGRQVQAYMHEVEVQCMKKEPVVH
jgi:hypothetical protein